MNDQTKKEVVEEEDFFKDLLSESDDDETEETEVNETEETEEEKKKKEEEEERRKNKDAEEARKRREADAKKKAEEDAKKKAEEDAKRIDEEKKQKQVDKLGNELVAFKRRYPDIELSELDQDKNFKKFIDGKLLGRKDFTGLYEEYIEFRSELSGKSTEEVRRNYQKKAESSSGSSRQTDPGVPNDIFSEEELEKITKRIPLMSDREAERILAKFEKSVEFYKNKK